MLTRTFSVTTEEGTSWLDPWEEPFQGRHVDQQLLPHLGRRALEKKELLCQFPKPDTLRVCYEDLSDGVYQILEVLSLAGRF